MWEDYFYYDESSPTYLRNSISKVGVKKGSIAGTVSRSRGYSFVKLFGKVYPAHRIIWEMHNFTLKPTENIDHINGVRSDNRLENLRAVSASENRRNVAKSRRNKSGVCGIRFRADKSCWVAFVKTLNGKDVQKSFTTTKYDYITSKLYAKMWRDTEISKLNLQGAGYSDRHGE